MRVLIRVLVVMAMVLAVANGQCLARCGTELCDSARPVSHCHEDPDSAPAASCAHPHFALPSDGAISHVTLEAGGPVMPAMVAVVLLAPAEPYAPDIARPRLCILKI